MKTDDEWLKLRTLGSSDAECPEKLANVLRVHKYNHVNMIGDRSILDNQLVGLCCSRRCSGEAILQTYDLARALRDNGIAVIGGFHSSMEKECLRLLLKGQQSIVIVPARSLSKFRVPGEWKTPIADRRLLLVSPFPETASRATSKLAEERNRFVFSLACECIVPFASPDGSISRLCREVASIGKRIWMIESAKPQVIEGITMASMDRLIDYLKSGT